MEVEVGLRVVRGPDWEWGEQDGGEGYVGTVVEVDEAVNVESGRSVVVQWDCGERCRYRCGAEGKYDLRVLDSAPTGIQHQFECYVCGVQEITGIMWQCNKCFKYSMCTNCYLSGKHTSYHAFSRIDTNNYNQKVLVPARFFSQGIKVMGIYPGARVVRGNDWKWGDQDGGIKSVGRVMAITSWKELSRCVAEVKWPASKSKKKNKYRLGRKGKVDLKLAPSGGASGGTYYPQHFPVLGAPYEPPPEDYLAAGDRIKVELDPDVWRAMQEECGGWNNSMAVLIGQTGMVMEVDDQDHLVVKYNGNLVLICKAAVTKVDTPIFHVGDVVRIMDDVTEVKRMQRGHGEWNDSMTECLGKLATVAKILPNGDLRLSVTGRRWIFNPFSVKHAAADETLPVDSETNPLVDPRISMQLTALEQIMSTDLVPLAAAAGDAQLLKKALSQRSHDVNCKLQGKSPLHIAATEGFTHIMKILLEHSPDLNSKDEDGDTPLHLCAQFNQEHCAEMLIGAGADMNAKNDLGIFPLHVVAASGHNKILRQLIKAPAIDLSCQTIEGNTALHTAVNSRWAETAKILLEAGADPSLYNNDCFNPILEAAKNGFYPCMEQFMNRYPEHINVRKLDDGHTPLHIAAANDHLDIVDLLASMDTCEVDAQNELKQLTPLDLAAQRGYSRIVECLIGYGANPAHTSWDGMNSVQHLTAMKNAKPPNVYTPYLKKFEEKLLVLNDGKPLEAYVILSAFLVSEGADISSLRGADLSSLDILKGADINPFNILGHTPSLICPPEVMQLLQRVSSQFRSSSSFRGSYPRFPPMSSNKSSASETFNESASLSSLSSTLSSLSTGSYSNPLHSLPLMSSRSLEGTSGSSKVNSLRLPDQSHDQSHDSSVDEQNPKPLPPKEEVPSSDSSLPVSLNDVQPVKDPIPPLAVGADLCVLCDYNVADVTFQPCGCKVMCSECVRDRIKRCPSCKKTVVWNSRD